MKTTNPISKHYSQEGGEQRRRLVSGSQSFILGAVIHTTNKILPYQNAMVENYLQVRIRNYLNSNPNNTKNKNIFVHYNFNITLLKFWLL